MTTDVQTTILFVPFYMYKHAWLETVDIHPISWFNSYRWPGTKRKIPSDNGGDEEDIHEVKKNS